MAKRCILINIVINCRGGVPFLSSVQERVQKVLDLIRPQIQGDGGDVELVGIDENNVVTVRLKGACVGCPMSQLTLKNGIERILKQQVPEVTAVEAAN
ncbi:MAG TPA: NifU family protein [Firmicutes bacterium]|nr:NifU family protein [Bacillota bacterium]